MSMYNTPMYQRREITYTSYVAGGDAGLCEHGRPRKINIGMAARDVGHQSRTAEQVATILA